MAYVDIYDRDTSGEYEGIFPSDLIANHLAIALLSNPMTSDPYASDDAFVFGPAGVWTERVFAKISDGVSSYARDEFGLDPGNIRYKQSWRLLGGWCHRDRGELFSDEQLFLYAVQAGYELFGDDFNKDAFRAELDKISYEKKQQTGFSEFDLFTGQKPVFFSRLTMTANRYLRSVYDKNNGYEYMDIACYYNESAWLNDANESGGKTHEMIDVLAYLDSKNLRTFFVENNEDMGLNYEGVRSSDWQDMRGLMVAINDSVFADADSVYISTVNYLEPNMDVSGIVYPADAFEKAFSFRFADGPNDVGSGAAKLLESYMAGRHDRQQLLDIIDRIEDRYETGVGFYSTSYTQLRIKEITEELIQEGLVDPLDYIPEY